MAKGREYISVYPDNYPQWYWTDGLHDACIVDVIEYERVDNKNILTIHKILN